MYRDLRFQLTEMRAAALRDSELAKRQYQRTAAAVRASAFEEVIALIDAADPPAMVLCEVCNERECIEDDLICDECARRIALDARRRMYAKANPTADEAKRLAEVAAGYADDSCGLCGSTDDLRGPWECIDGTQLDLICGSCAREQQEVKR